MSFESVFQRPAVQKQSASHPTLNLPQMLMDLTSDDPTFHRHMRMRTFRRGEVLADTESLQRQMFVLMTGSVHMVCTNNEGRRLVIATLEAGAVFGEGALTNPGEPNVFAEAATDGTLWNIPATEARSMTIQYPILGWGMLQTYGRRLQQVENSLEDVAYKKLPERLAALLVELGEETNGTIRGTSHQALADRLGTYRETVSAILRDFKRQSLVTLGYRRIEIVDFDMLKEIAGIWDW
ncbi:MAG: Crp/Fnr family transcriptional regulator [Caldilineaceae bacterium]|nr:Crp/Fnr family transcriptional regulator [Caldilineaceae bacterium]